MKVIFGMIVWFCKYIVYHAVLSCNGLFSFSSILMVHWCCVVTNPLTELTPPHLCSCSKSGCPTPFVVVFMCSMIWGAWGDCSFYWYWWNTVVSNHVNSDHVPSFSCLDVSTNRQATSGVYAITVTTSAYHSRRCGRL
jgi:hypothetical protein